MKNSHLAKILVRSSVLSWPAEVGSAVKIIMWEWADPPPAPPMFEIFHTFSCLKKKIASLKTKLFLQANATRGVIAALVVVAIFLGYALLDR